MTYRMRLLGRFYLSAPDGSEIALSAKKNQALLAVLAVAAGDWVPRTRLCDLLWEDRGEDQARNSLRQAIAALRRTFEPQQAFPLRVTDDAVALNPDAFNVDIRHLNGASSPDAVDGLAYGEFLEGLSIHGQSIQDWLLSQRQRFNTLYCEALAARVHDLETTDQHDAALAAARNLLDVDPLDENAHRAVIRLLAATGQRTAALKHYRTCSETLSRELSIDPDTATVELYERIRDNVANGPAVSLSDGAATANIRQDEIPGIVVLPFDNLSGDPDQDYFSNGLTDSITNELSRFHDLFVIASTSAFAYKNSDASTEKVCHELGVRYVLEGSVQRAGDRVRINTQLADGLSGRQLWSDRYDHKMEDMFAIQDDVTQSIVGTLATTYGGRLRKAWQQQRRDIKSADVKAFDLIMRAIDCMNKFVDEGVAQGRRYLLEAIDIDPDCAKAHAKLGWTYVLDAVEGWKDDYETDMVKARQCATRAIAADDGENWAHWIMAGVDMYSMQHDLAIAGFEKTVKLNPNDADVLIDFGYYLSLSGRAEDGLELAKKAMRLNPHYPFWYTVQLTQIYFDLRRYRDAVSAFEHVRDAMTPSGCLYIAASHAALGEFDQARVAVEHALELDPKASIRKWTDRCLLPYRKDEDMEHLRTYLRAAGLPE